MEVRFRLLDVFCDRPFAGNQLCVVPEPPADLDEAGMHTIAREIGFSETTFVTEAGGDRYTMRIFTPDQELPFAGHPTLGTAYLMVAEGRVTSPAIQTTAVGEVPVEIDVEEGFGWMRQRPPSFGPDSATATRSRGRRASTPATFTRTCRRRSCRRASHRCWRRCATSRRSARRARRARHPRGLERAGGECLYLFATTDDGVTARMFDPGAGIGEDPATGSAAGPLGAYLSARGVAGMPGRTLVAQGEQVGRPSFLHLEVAPEDDSFAVRVGGGVRVVGEGAFRL